MSGRMLIVDNEEAVRFFVADGLSLAGWQVAEADSGEAALAILESAAFDVVLLDLRLADINGLAVMRRVKDRWPEIMIIIITAYPSLDSAVDAIRQGAFDYLQKPCTVNDIMASADKALVKKKVLDRQRRLARHASKNLTTLVKPLYNPKTKIQSGDLVINLRARTVSLAGQLLSLSPTEYGLLKILAGTPGTPVSVERLIREGLEYDPNDPQTQKTLRVYISRLRRKIDGRYIRTIRGSGYALMKLPTID